jgi:hypothetical protein
MDEAQIRYVLPEDWHRRLDVLEFVDWTADASIGWNFVRTCPSTPNENIITTLVFDNTESLVMFKLRYGL